MTNVYAALLTIAFIASVVAIPYYLGAVIEKDFTHNADNFFKKWRAGFMCLFAIFAAGCIFLVLFEKAKHLIS